MSGVGASASLLAARPRAFAADTLVAATFPGTWNDAHTKILVPWFKNATKADAALTVQLATDQVAKLQAAGGKPPFDVAIMDEGPLLDAIKADLLVKVPGRQVGQLEGPARRCSRTSGGRRSRCR